MASDHPRLELGDELLVPHAACVTEESFSFDLSGPFLPDPYEHSTTAELYWPQINHASQHTNQDFTNGSSDRCLIAGLEAVGTASGNTQTELSAAINLVGPWSFPTGPISNAAQQPCLELQQQLKRRMDTVNIASQHTPSVIQDKTVNRKAVVTLRVMTDDIKLKDGFKWRRYGSKDIKNSAFKKFYFRCAERGNECPVVKRIQRCTDMEEFVDFTYIGRHNHPQP